MDPVSTALVAAVAKLSTMAIKDSYEALKLAITRRFGADSDIGKAVKGLEEKPDSNGRKEVLQEEIKASKADQDPDLQKLAQSLLQVIEKVETNPNRLSIQQRAGDNAVQIGQVTGNVDIKK